jgi:hypothetical protein
MDNKPLKVKEVANKLYPGVDLVILTGSAVIKNGFTPHSDLDVVLIDNRFSGVSSEVTKSESYRIDFTKLNKNAVYKTLLNEAYTSRGTIIVMFWLGLYISGDIDLFNDLKSIATYYHKMGSSLKKEEQQKMNQLAARIRKDIQKNIPSVAQLFLLTDFLNLLSNYYLIVHGQGWFGQENFRKHTIIKPLII